MVDLLKHIEYGKHCINKLYVAFKHIEDKLIAKIIMSDFKLSGDIIIKVMNDN